MKGFFSYHNVRVQLCLLHLREPFNVLPEELIDLIAKFTCHCKRCSVISDFSDRRLIVELRHVKCENFEKNHPIKIEIPNISTHFIIQSMHIVNMRNTFNFSVGLKFMDKIIWTLRPGLGEYFYQLDINGINDIRRCDQRDDFNLQLVRLEGHNDEYFLWSEEKIQDGAAFMRLVIYIY